MFIPIADYWMNGWGAGVPVVLNERGSANVSGRLATDVSVGTAILTNSARSIHLDSVDTDRSNNGATTPNATVGGATVNSRRPGE